MGGFFGIVYLLGQILNELFSCKNPSIDYLTYYYRVSKDDSDPKRQISLVTPQDYSSKKVWLEQTKPLSLTWCQELLNSSRVFLCFLQLCPNTRQKRLNKLLERASSKMDRSFDIRSIAQIRSKVITLARILLDDQLLLYLHLQRRHYEVDVKSNSSSDDFS